MAARPTRDAIETFMSITGAPESLAVQKLEEYSGNLDEAVNSYYSGGNGHITTSSFGASPNEQTPVEQSSLLSMLSSVRSFKPSLLLDPQYRRNLFNEIGASAFSSRSPFVPHQGDVSTEYRGQNEHPNYLGLWPTMGNMTGSPSYHASETHGNVVTRGNNIPTESNGSYSYGNDIEEEMIKAAIEASTLEALEGSSNRQLQEDDDLAHAISLSLKTADEEKGMHDEKLLDNTQQMGARDSHGGPGGTNSSRLKDAETMVDSRRALLPPEPELDDKNSVTILVRMPDGSRLGRRFFKSDKLLFLFNYIDISEMVKPGTYKVVRPYPRHAFGVGDSALTLADLGLTSKQEALFLELI